MSPAVPSTPTITAPAARGSDLSLLARLIIEADDLPLDRGGTWLCAAAGDGAVVRAVDAHLDECRRDGDDLVALPAWVCLEPDVAAHAALHRIASVGDVLRGDLASLEWDVEERGHFDVVVGDLSNEERLRELRAEVEVALGIATAVALRLRLEVLASGVFAGLLRHEPPDVYVVPDVFRVNRLFPTAWFCWNRRWGRTGPYARGRVAVLGRAL